MNRQYLTSATIVATSIFDVSARAQQAPPPEVPVTSQPAAAPVTEPRHAADAASSDQWKTSFYGFVEFDAMRDSTQTFGDSPGNGPILRSDGSSPAFLPLGTNPLGVTYGSTHPRMIFTARNSRFGFKVTMPEFAGMSVIGNIEVDFMGNQPSNPFGKTGDSTATESAFLSNAAVRVRHANVKIESHVVDVLFGQYYHLFGWQPLYFPASVAFLGLPNEIFGRTPQLRISKTVETGAIGIQVAGATLRPPQADGAFPDLHGGLRFAVKGWKGAHMAGSGQATLDPLSVGVTGAYRQFKVAEYTNNLGDPRVATKVAEASGYGISVDTAIPIIPIASLLDKSNALTLTGSFVTGAGIGDLFTGGLTGGAPYPRPEGPGGPSTGFYGANIDPGIVMYDAGGRLRLLNWQAFMVGFQYYLPFLEGRMVVAGNFTRAMSNNIMQQNTTDFTAEKQAGGDPTRTFKESNYYDANLFVDITHSVRAGLSWQRIEQTFMAGGMTGAEVMGDFKEHNDRFEIAGWFYF